MREKILICSVLLFSLLPIMSYAQLFGKKAEIATLEKQNDSLLQVLKEFESKFDSTIGAFEIKEKTYQKDKKLLSDQLAKANIETKLLEGDVEFESEDYEKAIELYTSAIVLDSNNSEAYRKRARSKRLLKQYEEALMDINTSIRLSPKDAKSYLEKGLCYYDQKDNEKAIQSFNKVIELDTGSAAGYYWRASAYKGKSLSTNYKKVIEDFDRAIEIDPKYKNVYLERGIAKYLNDKFESARLDFNKAIKHNPENAESYYMRGLANRDLGNHRDAIRDFNKIIELELSLSHIRDIHAQIGNSYSALDNNETAMEYYERQIEIYPEHRCDVYYYKSQIEYDRQNYSQALKDIEKFLDFYPKDPWGYNLRGSLKHNLEISGYCEDWNKAIELIDTDSNNFEIWSENVNKFCK